MRYIKDEVISLPKPITESQTEKPATFPAVLRSLIESYTPSDSLKLNLKDLRALNRTVDILEAKAENGYYALEDEHFQVVRRIVEASITQLRLGLARDIPVLLDALDASPQTKPILTSTSPDGIALEESVKRS